jgi:preprotein translocase subunit SecE
MSVIKSNIVIKFIGQVRDELKKVTWPTRTEVIRLTSIVLIVSFIVGAYLGAVDTLFTKLLEYLI